MGAIVLVPFAVCCGGKVAPNPDVMENYMSTVAINATLAAAVAATRTAIDVQEKVEATLNAPTPTTAPPTPTTESASIVLQSVDQVLALNWGVKYAEAGLYEMAIQEYNKAIELDPDDALVYDNRGSVYDVLGKWQNAINDYTKALQVDPDYARAYLRRGNLYRALGNIAQSNIDFAIACELNSGY